MLKLVLASGSPRRKELLERVGIPFETAVSGLDEDASGFTDAAEFALAMSRMKAMDVYGRLAGSAAKAKTDKPAKAFVPTKTELSDVAPADMKQGMPADPQRDLIVLGADTVVSVNGHILGKPKSPEEAAFMLRQLSDEWHDVITALTLVKAGAASSHAEYTHVKFRRLDEAFIRRYVATGEPMDKAGAYGIQGIGSLLVERIEGDYFNVMGLPLHRLSRMLAELGFEALSWLD